MRTFLQGVLLDLAEVRADVLGVEPRGRAAIYILRCRSCWETFECWIQRACCFSCIPLCPREFGFDEDMPQPEACE